MKELKNKSEQKKLLSVKNLKISFYNQGRYFQAVNDANFIVNKGDFFGIVGESGSGKTTIGKSIVRLVIPSSGEIKINGRLISNKKISRTDWKWLNKNVQMIFQDPSNSMNSIKTVLQTIYEPLAINKSLVKESIKFIRDILSIRKYCRYDFSIYHFELYQRFQLNYLTQLKKMYVELKDKIVPLLGIDTLQSNDIINILDEILQNFIDKMMDAMGEVHLFVESNKNLVQEQINFRTNGRLSWIDSSLFNGVKRLKIKKANARASYEVQKKQHYIRKLKQKIAIVKNDFAENNLKKCETRMLTWNSTIHNNISNYHNYMKLAEDEFLYTFNFIKFVEWKNILYFYKHVQNMQVCGEKELHNFIKLVNSKIDDVYNYLSNIVLENEKTFFEPNINKRDVFMKMRFLKKVAKKVHKLFQNSLFRGSFVSLEEFNECLNFASDYHVTDFQTQEFYQILSVIWKRISYLLSSLDNNSNKKRNELSSFINQFSNEIKAQKNLLKQLKANRDIDELNQAKDEYKQSKQELKKIKTERSEYIQNVYMKKWASFCKNKKQVDRQFLIWSQEIFELSVLFKNIIKKFKTIVFEKARNELSQSKIFNVVNDKSIWQKIKIKLKTIDSFDVEYRSLMSNTVLYRNLFQWKSFLPWLLLKKIINMKKQDKVFNVLKSVGLRSEHAYRYPHEFSGGQKQRIVIARALINKPKIIVADEPTSALDVSVQAQIINWMKDLTKKFGVTFLFIAHDLSVVHYVCNKVIIMHRGRIVEKGDTNEIFNNPIHPYTKSLLAAAPKLSRIHVDLSAFTEHFTYDEEYSITNVPTFYKIVQDQDHEVFATKSQFEKWNKPKNN